MDTLTNHNVKTVIDWLQGDVDASLEAVQMLNEEVGNKKNYEIDEERDEIVFFKKSKGLDGESVTIRIPVPVSLIGDICYDYTYGNMSGPKIVKTYWILPDVWTMLKSRLHIYKDSNALPDIVLDYMEKKEGPEAVENKIIDVSHKAVADKYRGRFINQFEKQRERSDDKIRRSFANIENFLSMLQWYIRGYKPREIQQNVSKDLLNTNVATFAFSDMHLWKQNTDWVLKRVEQMTNDITHSDEWIIHLLGLWDMIETIVDGWMHIWQVEHMDWPFGFDLMMLAVETIENMLIKIFESWKQLSFYWIGWNHDRMGKNHNEDMERTGALVIYEMVKRGVAKADIEMHIMRAKWNARQIDWLNYILHHWDDNASSKNAKDILWEQWRNDMYNIFICWDKHHKEEIDVSDNATKIILPAMAGSGSYDKRLSLSSAPWYMKFKNTEHWVETITKRLQN